MPATTAPADLAARLAGIELDAVSAPRIRLGSLWAQRTVVLVHLRHFG